MGQHPGGQGTAAPEPCALVGDFCYKNVQNICFLRNTLFFFTVTHLNGFHCACFMPLFISVETKLSFEV